MNNLIWYSQVHTNTGTANFCRNQPLSLHKLKLFDNITIKPDPAVPTKLDNPILNRMINLNPNVKDSIVIQVMWCERWGVTLAERPKYFIGYNAIEGTKIPYNWVKIMNDDDVDLTLTMSTGMRNMFIENGVKPKKLFALGHGYSPELYYPRPKAKDRPFTFLYLNGWRTSIGRDDRKGPEILLDAWVKGGFVNNPKYRLYMKVNMVYETKRDYFKDIKEKCGHDVSKWTNFVWDINDYPERAMPEVYNQADVFVSPTKGEGWGMTIQEAMAMGLPVIVPRNKYNGYMDFCNDDNCIFIDIDREEEVDSRKMGHFYSGSKWHIPSTDDLIKKMKYCYENQNEIKQIGALAHCNVEDNWTWDIMSRKLVKELKRRGMYQ